MIAGIQHDVSTYNPPPECVPWFRRLEDKLRRVYTVLTCSRVADVAPRQPAPRPTRHSTPTPDSQVPRSDQYPPRHEPRPRFTPPQPTSTRPMFEVGSSSQQPEHFEPGPSQPAPSQPAPSQPGPSSWVMPPHMMMQQPGMHQWSTGMQQPGMMMQQPSMYSQPSYAELIWSSIAPMMQQQPHMMMQRPGMHHGYYVILFFTY